MELIKSKNCDIDLSRIPLQCVRTIAPERGWGGHFHTFTVFLSTPTSARCYCLLECGKGLLCTVNKEDNSPSLRCARCPKAGIFVEMIRTKIQSLVRSRHFVEDRFSPPTWRPVYSVSIWNLLWLSWPLII